MTMKSVLPTALLSVLLAFAGCTALQAAEPSSTSLAVPVSQSASCRFPAFVQEADPAGLNVRHVPGLAGKVLGVLPPTFLSRELDGFEVRIALDVLAFNNGWFQIAHASDNPSLTGIAARKLYAGRGWVSGKKLTVKSQARAAYASPNTKAAVLVTLQDNGSFDNDEMVRAGHLLACDGQWALLEWTSDKLSREMRQQVRLSGVTSASATAATPVLPARFRGWVNQLCGLQETSCSGLAGQD